MPSLKLTGFSGEQPRIIPRLIPNNAAQSAINTRLDNGALTPFRGPSDVAILPSLGGASYGTIYRHGSEWLGWQGEINCVPGPVAADRLYFTGEGAPKMRVSGTVYALAVPRPASPLVGAVSGVATGDLETRLYLYSFVTSFGEESEPCAISAEVDWAPGQTVTLSGFQAAPAGRSITHQRIYRSQTGTTGTRLHFLAERAASAADFVDAAAPYAFQEPIPSLDYNAPPDGLAGLTSLPNGMMAAFDGRRLYFCEPWQPHAWPEKYVLTTESEIVGLGAIGDSLVVATKGQPYWVTGTTPDTMMMVKLEDNHPCVNSKGIADLGASIVYPSTDGLMAVKAGAATGNITANIFSQKEWEQLSPQTFNAGQMEGRWIASYNSTDDDGNEITGSIVVDTSGALPFLIRLDIRASAWFYDIASGRLFFTRYESAKVEQFDAPNEPYLSQYWRSKQFVLQRPDNFGAILVDSSDFMSNETIAIINAQIAAVIAENQLLLAAGSIGGDLNTKLFNDITLNGDDLIDLPNGNVGVVSVGIFADGKKVASVSRANQVCRLPSGFKARVWEIDVFGTLQIEQIVMAKTVDELASVQ